MRLSHSCELIYLSIAAFSGFDDSYKREILVVYLIEDTFQCGGVRKELPLFLSVRCPVVNEVTTLPVLRLDAGEIVDDLYFAVQNVGNRHLRTVEDFSVVLLFDTEFAEPLCHGAPPFYWSST